MTETISASEYVNQERRDYSLYVLHHRAIPYAADGLKAGARRVLWTGKNGNTYKSASLAGAAMPLHPHKPPENSVNTLAAFYTNNVPLLVGEGAFGTLLNPAAYGASKYTSVKISQFTKDVLFQDIDIIPMKENYDGSLQEPEHFLPLIPLVLLNQQQGIAVGFASNTLPRSLPDIINSQLAVLEEKKFVDALPSLKPINQTALRWEKGKAVFVGSYEKTGATTVKITNLPYGVSHEKYKAKLDKLLLDGSIVKIKDDSRDKYNIDVKFKRGILSKFNKEEILKFLSLYSTVSENLTVIDFDGETVWTPTYEELIRAFCEWRLTWYVPRFQRLSKNLQVDIQKYKDILLAIRKNIGGLAKKIQSRSELKDYLIKVGVVNVDYISDLSVYRFTEEEKTKVEGKLIEAEVTLQVYESYLNSEAKRKELYVSELKEILKKYKEKTYG